MRAVKEEREDALLAATGDSRSNPKSPMIVPDGGASQTQSNSPQSPSIYTIACDESLMSNQMDQWLGAASPRQTLGVQGSRPALVQRSTLAADSLSSLSGTGVWYILALLMPLINIADGNRWRCSQIAVMNFMELISSHVIIICHRVRCRIRGLAQSQTTREMLATVMDVVLVLYAIGFLFLSVYQAAIFT